MWDGGPEGDVRTEQGKDDCDAGAPNGSCLSVHGIPRPKKETKPAWWTTRVDMPFFTLQESGGSV